MEMGKQVHVDEEDELNILNFQMDKTPAVSRSQKTPFGRESEDGTSTVKLTQSSPFKGGFLSTIL